MEHVVGHKQDSHRYSASKVYPNPTAITIKEALGTQVRLVPKPTVFRRPQHRLLGDAVSTLTAYSNGAQIASLRLRVVLLALVPVGRLSGHKDKPAPQVVQQLLPQLPQLPPQRQRLPQQPRLAVSATICPVTVLLGS